MVNNKTIGSARPASLFGGSQPIYLTIADALSEAIQSGQYPVGTLLPAEAELCKQYGVSRHTVREALRKLKEIGLISRLQGVGTRVESSEASSHFVLSLGSIPDIWQYVRAKPLKVLKTALITAGEAEIALPKIGGREEWLLVEGVRFLYGKREPISHSRIHVNGRYRGVLEDVNTETDPVFSLVERRYGVQVVSIRQSISAITVPKRLAKPLQMREGEPCLEMIRTYVAADGTVTAVGSSVTPWNRFTYEMELKRSFGGKFTSLA